MKVFGLPPKGGGAKNFRLGQFFFNVPIYGLMANTQVFQVFRVLGALLIFWSKGGIPYNNRESPYLHIVFYMISFFFYNFNIHFQDVLKNIDSLIIFSPHFQVYNFRPLLITSKNCHYLHFVSC